MFTLKVNGTEHRVEVGGDTPLLWALRESLGLIGTKYGCGVGQCGACTVLLDGEAVRSCVVPVEKASGREITTIEGLGREGLHPVQRAWILEEVSQCGYCQPGQIVSAAALLAANPDPSDGEIEQAVGGNLCRCGTYRRIGRAIRRASRILHGEEAGNLPAVPALAADLLAGPPLPVPRPSGPERTGFHPNPWVSIEPDGTVSIRVSKSEMGQGVLTPLAAAVAQELRADWSRVRIEPAPAGPDYVDARMGRQITGGSTSLRFSAENLRRAGAQARHALVAAAAQAWGVPAERCVAENGRVRDPITGEERTYGELAEPASRAPVLDPAGLTLDPFGDSRLLGTPLPRADALPKARGAALFGLDVRLEGQLTAVVARCPVPGGRVATHRDERARRVPGVRSVVPISSGVAVVADSVTAALEGRRALEVEWDVGPLGTLDDSAVSRLLEDALGREGLVAEERGDALSALREGEAVPEARYFLPYLAHAPIEPMNATAWVGDGRCEVWVPTQNQSAVLHDAAEAAGVPESRVRVHTTFLGGGFGRRLQADYAAEAAEIARAAGRPVQVVWTREDDLGHDFYRPASAHAFRAALGPGGLLQAWHHQIATPSLLAQGNESSRDVDPTSVEGAVGLPYSVPHVRIEWVPCNPGIPVGFWRSVGHSHTAFAVECFLDEVAAAAGLDPLELRLRLLGDAPRHRAVLELAAERAGWGSRLPEDRGRGLALHESYGSIVAEVAEVTVAGGGLRVERVVAAVDCGPVFDPAGLAAQIEGGVTMGLSAALGEAIGFEDGRVAQTDFKSYRLLRFGQAPAIEVHVVPNPSSRPGGIGEPGVPPAAPAVANAVSALLGRRIRRLPLLPLEDLSARSVPGRPKPP